MKNGQEEPLPWSFRESFFAYIGGKSIFTPQYKKLWGKKKKKEIQSLNRQRKKAKKIKTIVCKNKDYDNSK